MRYFTNYLICLKSTFEKSLAINKDLKAGEVIKFEDLEAKKPQNYGIPAKDFRTVIGKHLKLNLPAFSFINESDLES